MKAKGQTPISSELEAKEKLIVYVYEYLTKVNAKRAAETFLQEIRYENSINVNTLDGPGFLANWWYVFWDLYCAAPEKRNAGLAEPSSEARAFIEYNMHPSMSPHHQTPPPHQAPYMQPGPRYAPQPPNHPVGPPPPPPMSNHPGGPPQMRHHGPPGPQAGFMSAGSPRYAQHPGPPPPQPHMNQPGPMGFGPGPDRMGPSPGLNRMTPVGGPPPQHVAGPPPPNGMQPQMIGGGMPPGQQMGGPPPGQGPSQVNLMQGGPPRDGSQGNAGGWQGNVNYGNVNSPANQPCYASGSDSNQPNQGGPMMMGDGGMMEVKSSPIDGGDQSQSHSHMTNNMAPGQLLDQHDFL